MDRIAFDLISHLPYSFLGPRVFSADKIDAEKVFTLFLTIFGPF